MNPSTDKEREEDSVDLLGAGWRYLGCDYWEDAITGSTYIGSVAAQIVLQRALFDRKDER